MLGKRVFLLALLLICEVIQTECSSLTFDEAVQLIFYNSPQLKVSESEVGEMEGIEMQTDLYPNPIFSYSVENVFGNKHWKGWESAESRYEISQLVETAGKRNYRKHSATYQVYAKEAHYEAKKLQALNQLLKLFATAAAAQEEYSLAEEQLCISEEIYRTVSEKVDAGKASLIQKNKAEIALSTARFALEKADLNFATAKERLSALWGCTNPDFDQVDFPFYELDSPIPIDECLTDLKENPELLRSQFEHLSAYQILNLEQAEAIPDVVFTLGIKTLRKTHESGMIIGASIPLPIFNRNQGNIQRAMFQTQRTRDQYYEVQIDLEKRLSIAHRELLRAYREAEQLRSTVLHTALQSFEFAQEGYREGKFEYLDMLDSQRTLFEVREYYIHALLNYHQSKADIEYLNIQDDFS